nr:hypothetical protein PHANIE_0020 [Acinetobacter phage Phanie]
MARELAAGWGYIWTLDNAKFKKEISRMAAIANKRIARLESNNLETSPAYKKWIDEGGVKFGVRGKTHNELQKEASRLQKFLESETSTVRGVNKTLKTMATNTGITYKNMVDLRGKAEKFFELASKVEQYLRQVEDIASAIGYQRIWEAINVYVKQEKVDLNSGKVSIDEMIEKVNNVLENYAPNIWGDVPSSGNDDTWFKLL